MKKRFEHLNDLGLQIKLSSESLNPGYIPICIKSLKVKICRY